MLAGTCVNRSARMFASFANSLHRVGAVCLGPPVVVTGPVFDEAAALERVMEDEYCITKIGATVRDRRGRVTGFGFGIDSMRGGRLDRIP